MTLPTNNNKKGSPKPTEHAEYHHIQDYELLQVHLLLCESETNYSLLRANQVLRAPS